MRWAIGGAIVLVAAAIAANAAPPQYTLTPLAGFSNSTPDSLNRTTGINNSGQVIGDFYSSPISDGFAFRTTANAGIDPAHDLIDLRDCCPMLGDPPKTIDSFASAINDSGQVAGWGYLGGAGYVGFRTKPNAPIDWQHDVIGELFSGGSTLPHGMNASGQLTGSSGPDSGPHAFRTGPNAAINPLADDLGVLSGYHSEGLDINDSGVVAGNFYVYDADLDDDVPHAFRSQANGVSGPSIDLGGLGGRGSSAQAINNAGQIVGWARRTDGHRRAFRLAPGDLITAANDLGTLNGDDAAALDINNLGWIVGDAGGAFVHDDSTMWSLQGLIADASWSIDLAFRINDRGQILALAEHNGVEGYVRLDPVPEPGVCLLIIMTTAALGWGRGARRMAD